jgi:hypothetical protein
LRAEQVRGVAGGRLALCGRSERGRGQSWGGCLLLVRGWARAGARWRWCGLVRGGVDLGKARAGFSRAWAGFSRWCGFSRSEGRL